MGMRHPLAGRIALLLALLPTLVSGADVAKAVLDLTSGAEARFVWVRRADPGTDTKFTSGDGPKAQLMAFDTASGTERILQPAGTGGYMDPFITRDGQRVVWSDNKARTTFIADFAGGERKVLSSDTAAWFALCTIRDAAGVDWIYAYDGSYFGNINVSEDDPPKSIYRYPLAKGPAAKELVWNKAPFDARSFHVSGDGKLAAACYPWPKAGFAWLPNGEWVQRNYDVFGCNPDVAPDASYRFFYMEGSHTKIRMYADPKSEKMVEMPVNLMAGNLGKKDVWRPRWTNLSRYLVISSPLGVEDDWLHLDEVYVGRFDAAFTKVEAWVQLTDNKHRDLDICGWVAPVAGKAPAKAKK